ncbi:MAG: hypothetical protein BJ554DRAFT_1099, partial [Olpidium bornovanus]
QVRRHEERRTLEELPADLGTGVQHRRYASSGFGHTRPISAAVGTSALDRQMQRGCYDQRIRIGRRAGRSRLFIGQPSTEFFFCESNQNLTFGCRHRRI